MTARGRDLRTTSDATSVVINQVDLSLRVDGSNRQVLSIASSPALPGLDQLVGCPVGPGFRARVNEACPGEREAGTLLHLLLDDLPGAALVSGYSAQRAGALDQPRRRAGGRCREHVGPGPDDGIPGRPLRRMGPRSHPDGDRPLHRRDPGVNGTAGPGARAA